MATRIHTWLMILLVLACAGPARGAAAPPNLPEEEKTILTPKPGPEPKINGPRLFGGRPGRPFLYRIPTTGRRPMSFTVDKLPEGLAVDSETGIITGSLPQDRGEYAVVLRAKNTLGAAAKRFTIVVGDQLALTPPMGWNHWYTWYHRITSDKMKQAADQMVDSGMADVGYMYVNIDDCWMKMPPEGFQIRGERLVGLDVDAVVGKTRDASGRVLSNAHFPDMKGLADYIHSRGLRAGLYTSPGPRTCQQYEGSYQHERQDAEQYAEWGFDFLKYDWCAYGKVAGGEGLERMQRPYKQMGEILNTLDRDIVLNLCQYGMGDVWQWGEAVGGNCWRTTGDLGLEDGDRLPGFYHIGFSNLKHWQHARPGAWNDPDYLLLGWVGVPPAKGVQLPKPTTLTGNEQYSYMSMWCLMAAPLFFSGDMARLDEFTLNVLCNPEVIEVDQDALGKQATPIVQNSETLILAKPMEDSSLAVGLFNLNESPRELSVTWRQLGLEGPQRIRDLWRQKELGLLDDQFAITIPRHGVSLVRLWPQKQAEPTKKTHVYKQVGNLEIKANVYEYSDAKIRPALVWIHGGALIMGHRDGISGKVRQFAFDNDYVLVSLDYRLAPETKLPQIIQDLEDAFRWLRREGPKRFHIDPDRIAVAGGSAGGYMTLTAGFRVEPRPRALLALWGYGDLVGDWYSKPSPHQRHQGTKMSREEAWNQVSGPPISDSRDRKGNGGAFYQYCRQTGTWPKAVSGWDPHKEPEKFYPFMAVKNVDGDYPPTVMIHGMEDTDVPYEQSTMMAEQFRKHGVEYELHSIENAEHGLPGGDPAEIEAAYRSAFEFVKRHLER